MGHVCTSHSVFLMGLGVSHITAPTSAACCVIRQIQCIRDEGSGAATVVIHSI